MYSTAAVVVCVHVNFDATIGVTNLPVNYAVLSVFLSVSFKMIIDHRFILGG